MLFLVSYDVFFQEFSAGEPSGTGGAKVREVVSPYVIAEDEWSLTVRMGDGEADLYLSHDSMMANHISGSNPWHLLVVAARAANWVILLPDGPVCLTAPGQREVLPAALADNVVFVESGEDLLRAVKGT